MPHTRLWCRHPDYFIDHPRYDSSVPMNPLERPPEVWANQKALKIKVYCKPCLAKHVGEVMSEEEARVDKGELAHCRTKEEITLWLFNRMDTPHTWIESRGDTLLQHLKDCDNQPAQYRQKAADHIANRKLQKHNKDVQKTPTATRTYTYSNAIVGGENPYHANAPQIVSPQPVHRGAPPPVLHYQSQPGPSFLSMQEQSELQQRFSAGTEMPVPYLDTSAPAPGPSYSNNHNFGPLPHATYSSNMVPHWDTVPDPFHSRPNSSASFTRTDTPTGDSGSQYSSSYRSKRSRTSGNFAEKRTISQRQSYADLNAPRPASVPVPVWTQSQQDDFNISIALSIASGDLPLSVVENRELINLFKKLAPQAKMPSRKTMTQTVIPRLVKNLRETTQAAASGQLLTLQCDGWTGKNFIHLIAFMASSATDMFTVKVFDTTIDRKTAENLLELIETVMEMLKNKWGSEVTSVTSDASGESAKAHRLLKEKYPELVLPDCAAHQINLIVGDYFKTTVWLFEWTGKANDLITWLRSKTAILGLIREALSQQGKRPLSVIRPVPTRWTAFYLAYDRLIKLRSVLVWIIENDADKPVAERQIIQPAHERSAREKAARMIDIINHHEFWVSLTRVVTHLRPLAIAANVTQAKHTRLDQVFVMLGKLVQEYQGLGNEHHEVKHALISNIERRWGKMDKDVLVAALFLNPFHKIDLFRINAERTSIAAMHILLSRLWRRFYKEDSPSALYNEVSAYMESKGVYGFVKSVCETRRKDALANNTSPDPFQVYHDIGSLNVDRRESLSPLVRLAQRILSICANSASCERLFSSFGLILTKLRTRLSIDNLVNLAELKMYIRDEHPRDKDAQNAARQRFFGHRQGESASGDGPSQMAPLQNQQHLGSGEGDGGLDGDPQLVSDSDSGGPPRGLRAIATHLSRLASEDDYESESDSESDDDVDMPAASALPIGTQTSQAAPSASSTTRRRRQQPVTRELPDFKDVTIAEIFDFTRESWKEIKQRSAVLDLEKELDMYDLLDLDAPGDLDPDIEDSLTDFFEM
ncbi:hypothetical protein D9619_008286 [Psilocybe cf. subviscida]|uniref:DUF659 domain-containing protein n=1 Tax=Psilocybe cf. subviscida TaxID=2480587 RepID=A0A8H5B9P3_9AGAR|nr:hypothetical protein D9619_008286 [Psilocybe cf. subviscida]